jgi:excisionase family DNA binding protein
MLTVPEAARRVGRDPETVRRWIRSGKLRSEKVGTQHLVEERELEALVEGGLPPPWPKEWRDTWTGEPPVDWAEVVRRSRLSH